MAFPILAEIYAHLFRHLSASVSFLVENWLKLNFLGLAYLAFSVIFFVAAAKRKKSVASPV